jgi:hypothetical protein
MVLNTQTFRRESHRLLPKVLSDWELAASSLLLPTAQGSSQCELLVAAFGSEMKKCKIIQQVMSYIKCD